MRFLCNSLLHTIIIFQAQDDDDDDGSNEENQLKEWKDNIEQPLVLDSLMIQFTLRLAINLNFTIWNIHINYHQSEHDAEALIAFNLICILSLRIALYSVALKWMNEVVYATC